MDTIYRPVPGYADLYAGMDGTIVHGAKGRALTQLRQANGYLRVRIPGINERRLVHRLVAAAFLGSCPDGMQVRHEDGTRTNNQLGNLCYGTARDNAQDSVRHGTHASLAMSAKTHCVQGHPYSESNTYSDPRTGHRHCRICREDASSRRNRRRWPAGHIVKTHCPQGHEYTAENTYRYPKTGKRACRICQKMRNDQRRQS